MNCYAHAQTYVLHKRIYKTVATGEVKIHGLRNLSNVRVVGAPINILVRKSCALRCLRRRHDTALDRFDVCLLKAMVVTNSRLHAVRYKLSFDKYIQDKVYDDIKTLVAYSGEVKDKDVKDKAYNTEARPFAAIKCL